MDRSWRAIPPVRSSRAGQPRMNVARLVRSPWLRPFWARAHRASLVGLNYWASAFQETGEREAIDFVRERLSDVETPIIFDVGANVGEFSKACLDAFGQRCLVHAFEPSPATFALLSQALGTAPQIALHRLGFSNSEREDLLYSSEPGSTIASVHRLDRPIRPFRDEFTETISLTTIDRFCATAGLPRIDFLKLDIEGHELFALRGAADMLANGRIKFIQFEFGENDISSRTFLSDFHALLGEHYRWFQVVPGGPQPWNYEGGRSEIFATMNYLCERNG